MNKVSYGEFQVQYKKWYEQAMEEFKESEFWHDEYEELESIDICEDGRVYISFYHYIDNVVTRWDESEFYVE